MMSSSTLDGSAPEALLDAIPDAILVVKPEGTLVHVNNLALLMFRYEAQELTCQSFEVLFPEIGRSDNADCRTAFVQGLSHGLRWPGLNLMGQRKDGTTFPTEVNLSTLGEGSLLIAVIRDITNRVKTESELAIANQALTAYSYSVAHDLMAPIRIMSGFASLLRRDHLNSLDPKGREALEMIVNEASEAERLIQGLLSLAKLGRDPLAPQMIDLSVLALNVARNLRLEQPERVVEVIVEDGLKAYLDPRLARSLMYNLISNAWKFTAPRPDARIEVGRSGDDFFVRDNGVGFDPRQSHRLFLPFERLHGEEYEGHGVGLALCYRIVRQHGGSLRAESLSGGGAAFFFCLPAPVNQGTP
jgi:PAS domain S-box-containing protein